MASISEQPTTPFPFGVSERTYRLAWQAVPTRDLEAEVESAQWLALDLIDDLGESYEIAAIQLEVLTSELFRRRRLLERHRDHPLAPRWPQRTVNLQTRIDAVKQAWSVERICTDLLLADPKRSGNHWIACCPLPGHDDASPSFHIYDDHAWCFGCNRGGDQIQLAKILFGTDRFFDALEALEAAAGIADRGVS